MIPPDINELKVVNIMHISSKAIPSVLTIYTLQLNKISKHKNRVFSDLHEYLGICS